MSNIKHTLAAALFAAALIPAASAVAERPAVGAIDKVQLRAEAIYGGDARRLADGAPVIFEDRLQTGKKARLQSTLKDGTKLTLGENASLVVDEFAYDPAREGGKLAFEVVQGAFLFVGGAIEGKTGGNVDITTPIGTLGVRGTTVWGGTIDDGYGILVLDGEVVVSTAGGAVTLKAGEATMIMHPMHGPSAPHAWPQEKIDRAVKTISFN